MRLPTENKSSVRGIAVALVMAHLKKNGKRCEYTQWLHPPNRKARMMMGSGNPKSQAAQPHLASPNRRIRLIIMSEAPLQERGFAMKQLVCQVSQKNRAGGTRVAAPGTTLTGDGGMSWPPIVGNSCMPLSLPAPRRGWPRPATRMIRPRRACPPGRWARPASNVSILCLGGWHIGSVKDEKEAIKIMHAAIDEGMTFFDNAWDYHDGGSEEVMGKALADARRSANKSS